MRPPGFVSQEDIAAIASGRHQMDAFVRRYIHENLSDRFVMPYVYEGPDTTVEMCWKGAAWSASRKVTILAFRSSSRDLRYFRCFRCKVF
jgi:hypothetical protein